MSGSTAASRLLARQRQIGYRNQAIIARGRAYYCRVHGEPLKAQVWEAKAEVWDRKARAQNRELL